MSRRRLGAIGLALAATLSLGVTTIRTALATPSPVPASVRPPSEIVLAPTDVGPDFVLVRTAEVNIARRGWFAQSLARSGQSDTFIAVEGFAGVTSLATVFGDPAAADREFQVSSDLVLRSLEEVPVPAIADRVRAGLTWGKGPFEPAEKAIIFRSGPVVGTLRVATFDAPVDLDDTLRLAQIMIARARG